MFFKFTLLSKYNYLIMNCTHAESETLTLMDVTSNPSIIVSMQEEKNQSKKKNLCTPCLVANHEM